MERGVLTLAPEERERLVGWLPHLAGRRVLVVGDLCLDEYIVGRAQRLSREAPVPVLEYQRRFLVPGAAANPALNIRALGGVAAVAGVVGQDEEGRSLADLLGGWDIDGTGLVVDSSRSTTVKTRILAEVSLRFPQQVARVDRQERRPLDRGVQRQVLARLEALAPGADAVLISDYKSGVVDRGLVQAICHLAQERGMLVTVDSQGDLDKFRGATVIKCNQEEAAAFLRRALQRDDDFARAARLLQRRLGAQAVIITRGSSGMSVASNEETCAHLPAVNRSEVYDVTGAGDTVIATLTLALAAGVPLVDAAHLANYAAGIVVRRLGNATTSPQELARTILGVET
ncbi:MAG: bifunctional hydroxymethylpyrimidine kinase/phosphomethylpyrimidine kinase [Chloroflexi bacterium]|nr:bifunctional hydroxymethylpyrimidine kinase/phosphomethylpyrimidine kinase [Chloroflexota bacterium]